MAVTHRIIEEYANAKSRSLAWERRTAHNHLILGNPDQRISGIQNHALTIGFAAGFLGKTAIDGSRMVLDSFRVADHPKD